MTNDGKTSMDAKTRSRSSNCSKKNQSACYLQMSHHCYCTLLWLFLVSTIDILITILSYVDNVEDMGKGFVIVMCHFILLYCLLYVVHFNLKCFLFVLTMIITVYTITCQNASCQPLCLSASSSRNVHMFWHQEPHTAY